MFFFSSTQTAGIGLRNRNCQTKGGCVMLMATSSNIYQVDVYFDADCKHLTFSGVDVVFGVADVPVAIPVAPGLQIINFTLTTSLSSPSPQAEFKFYPIQWIGTPDLLPATGLGQWFDSTHCRMVVLNSNTSTFNNQFGFILTVMYEGVAYSSSDPTIINEPVVQ
jgi:hypothetical protein